MSTKIAKSFHFTTLRSGGVGVLDEINRPDRSQGIVIKFYLKDMLDYPRLWMFEGFFL